MVHSGRIAYLGASDTHVAGTESMGLALGLCIGTASTFLGVAGRELLIPTLIFVFGADILVEGSRAWRSFEDYLLHRPTCELMRAEGLGLASLSQAGGNRTSRPL